MAGVTSKTYRRPLVRAHVYRRDLPKVLTVHEHRFVGPALVDALAGRWESWAMQRTPQLHFSLVDMLTPTVVVAGELLGDGVIDHFLPDLVRGGTRVLLLVDDIPGDRMLALVRSGLSAVCSSSDDALTDVANTNVLDVAAGGVVLPPLLTLQASSAQWRSDWRKDGTGSEEPLTLRETEVLNAITDGLSTKATARLLGLAVKTVENHKTRVFAKLGVRNQAHLVAEKARGRPSQSPLTAGAARVGPGEH